MLARTVFTILFFVQATSFATEVDNFTVRTGFTDSRSWLNEKMNASLKEAAAETKTCDPFELHKALYKKLGGPLYAKIELWSAENPNVIKLPIDRSIYRQISKKFVSNFGLLPVPMKTFYTEHNLMMNDVIFGDDKLGHFFQVGYDVFYAVRKKSDEKFKDARGAQEKYGDLRFGSRAFVKKSKLKGDALAHALNQFLEEGQWGAKGPGVKSYGDIAANWEGYRFWNQLTEGPHPYFNCSGSGRFELTREFDFADYVTAAWDEGINCSVTSEKLGPTVQKEILDRSKGGCPIAPNSCRELRARYGEVAAMILSSSCLKAADAEATEKP